MEPFCGLSPQPPLMLKIRIRDINPHIVCSLCAGYFVEATTITECLHTFCKSCIVKYLQSSKFCPQCNTKIHETQPTIQLKPDRVMQDIVYKLVPGLYEGEERRKQEFYKARGLVKEQKKDYAAPALTSIYDNPEAHYYRNDEMLCLCLEKDRVELPGMDYLLPGLPKKFVRCSVRTRVEHVKSLLVRKLSIPPALEVELLCCDSKLQKGMTLKHVWLSHWFGRNSPMMLYYTVRYKQFVSPDYLDATWYRLSFYMYFVLLLRVLFAVSIYYVIWCGWKILAHEEFRLLLCTCIAIDYVCGNKVFTVCYLVHVLFYINVR